LVRADDRRVLIVVGDESVEQEADAFDQGVRGWPWFLPLEALSLEGHIDGFMPELKDGRWKIGAGRSSDH
jgi:hypothetical protein